MHIRTTMQVCRVGNVYSSISARGSWLLAIYLLFAVALLQVGVTRADDSGSCDGNNVCSNGLCCSQYFFCGSNASYCGDGCRSGPCFVSQSKDKSKGLSSGVIIGIAVAVVLVLIVVLGTIVFAARRWRTKGRLNHRRGKVIKEDLEAKPFEAPAAERGRTESHALSYLTRTLSVQHSELGSRLSYETLYAATNRFSEELGRGAFGVVYKGTLEDGTKIAVKRLVDGERDVKDFEAEVKTLGCINHANLVALIGFTYEGNEYFVIYEYVANKSLDRWIFQDSKADPDFVLSWRRRVEILRGTAKGLAYLHEELQRGRAIVHLDIKPQNILLDESFVPKIADFGLAKLLGQVANHQTLPAGGTMGYMAPEVYVGAASPKMDVYSFGMLMLEVVSGREHVDLSGTEDSFFLPAWANRKIHQHAQLDVVDPLLAHGEFDANQATRLVWSALLCLQRDPDERPSMSAVLRMMEGGASPPDLPPTLQSELEMAERLIRRRSMAVRESVNFIKFSGDSENRSQGSSGRKTALLDFPSFHHGSGGAGRLANTSGF